MKEPNLKTIRDIVNKNSENGILSTDQFDDNLSELGIDSLSFVRIIIGLEEYFDCEIPDSKLLISEMNTIQKMFDVLQSLYEKTMQMTISNKGGSKS